MYPLKILVACEESQAVTIAFRERGFEAYSCDILDCSGGHPEWHIKGDVLEVINQGWDVIIAFPPCTYLSNAGAAHLYKGKVLNQDRFKKGLNGRGLFMKIYNASAIHICIENPTPSKVYELPNVSQIIQPYYFGDAFKKRTCLWLKGLPLLKHNDTPNLFENSITHVEPKYHFVNSSSNYKHGNLSPGKHRSAKNRSKTFPGIAKSMAEQWGDYLISKYNL